METKICSKCKIEKEVCDFRVDKSKKDGLYPSCKRCCSELRLSKREYHIQRSKEWYDENYEEFQKRRWIKTKNNPEKLKKAKISQRIWGQNNKEKRNEYAVLRRKINPIVKLCDNVRTRLRFFLKLRKIDKKNKTFDIVGCSPEFLKEHLEKQFRDGMSWENRCEWHIDHIIPLSSAKTEEEIYKLCHYTNLQPLWAKDNLSKNNKIIQISDHQMQ